MRSKTGTNDVNLVVLSTGKSCTKGRVRWGSMEVDGGRWRYLEGGRNDCEGTTDNTTKLRRQNESDEVMKL